jgi:hypothetical protein
MKEDVFESRNRSMNLTVPQLPFQRFLMSLSIRGGSGKLDSGISGLFA